MIIVTDAFST